MFSGSSYWLICKVTKINKRHFWHYSYQLQITALKANANHFKFVGLNIKKRTHTTFIIWVLNIQYDLLDSARTVYKCAILHTTREYKKVHFNLIYFFNGNKAHCIWVFTCCLCCLKPTFSSHILSLCFLSAGVEFMNMTHEKPVEMSHSEQLESANVVIGHFMGICSQCNKTLFILAVYWVTWND